MLCQDANNFEMSAKGKDAYLFNMLQNLKGEYKQPFSSFTYEVISINGTS
jgi:hypothetical protein